MVAQTITFVVLPWWTWVIPAWSSCVMPQSFWTRGGEWGPSPSGLGGGAQSFWTRGGEWGGPQFFTQGTQSQTFPSWAPRWRADRARTSWPQGRRTERLGTDLDNDGQGQRQCCHGNRHGTSLLCMTERESSEYDECVLSGFNEWPRHDLYRNVRWGKRP